MKGLRNEHLNKMKGIKLEINIKEGELVKELVRGLNYFVYSAMFATSPDVCLIRPANLEASRGRSNGCWY